MPLRRYWLAVAFVGCAFCVSATGYVWLPPHIAVHWDLAGHPDRWMAKPIGAFILPVMDLVTTAVLIAVAPKASSRVQPDTTPNAYATVVAAIAALLLYATISVVAVAVGFELNVPAYAAVGFGVLLAILGNTLGKTRRNSLLGVRTPWTLASEEVWSRTNRLVGRLLILGGVVIIVAALVGWGIIAILCVIAATAMVATIHSYITAKHLRGDT